MTILSHPSASRVGQRALLEPLASDGVVEISRRSPLFSPPDSLWTREALEDPFLSRSPWLLERQGLEGLRLRRCGSNIELRVQGELVADEVEISWKRLEFGVVLELAGRVALLLHQVTDAPPPKSRPEATLVGESDGMRQVREAIARVARFDLPVLVRGETGTGKELVARALHRQGRSGRPFVAVSLAALSPSLAAAELFGNVKGAYTGASHARAGLFRAADGGTLFLDEVGEAPVEVQALLLRVLETRHVLPVGSQTPVAVDVRLVAATDASLEAMAAAGKFRVPLLHRLAAYEIWLPPLRARRDDIGRLFLHFIRDTAREMGLVDRLRHLDAGGEPWVDSALMGRLGRFSWPGNVRQLRNVVQQLLVDAQEGAPLRASPRLDQLLAEDGSLPESASARTAASAVASVSAASSALAASRSSTAPRRTPADVTPEQLETALREHRFEPAAAARQLGISRPSVYRLIREHPRLRVTEDLEAEQIRAALDDAEGVVRQAAQLLEVSARALGRRIRRDGLS